MNTNKQPVSSTIAKLQALNQTVAGKQAQEKAKISAQQAEEERRRGLFQTAQQSLKNLQEQFATQVLAGAPLATVTQVPYLMIQLGDGELSIQPAKLVPPNALMSLDCPPVFDVIAQTVITVKKPCDRFGYEGRSHSLWYCDAYNKGDYRWFETAFMLGVFVQRISPVNPFALSLLSEKEGEQAASCFSQRSSNRQIAWQPLPCDLDNEEQFIERWLNWFVGAAGGGLQAPLQMPEDSGGHYRSLHTN